jgi:hypothetical protein
MKYLIDSFAWIKYFMGTKTGERVKSVIEKMERLQKIIKPEG